MESFNEKLSFVLPFLAGRSFRRAEILTWEDWSDFKSASMTNQWIYLYVFGNDVLAWGTTSKIGSNDRLRKAAMFHPKLTGKYDRRVDYLMLKIIYGMPKVFAYEIDGKATDVESDLRRHFNQTHCFLGVTGKDRSEISQEIVRQFKSTTHYLSLTSPTKDSFERYLTEVYFTLRRHPSDSTRTFFWGDSLEPGFMQTIGLKILEPAIEQTLRVCFRDQNVSQLKETVVRRPSNAVGPQSSTILRLQEAPSRGSRPETIEKMMRAKKLYGEGKTLSQIAQALGLSVGRAGELVKGVNWDSKVKRHKKIA